MSIDENDELKPKKSRHLSILDFFDTLQVEYILADLRHKIYPRLKDKAYWNKVMVGKKATIEKLATRNSLPSIFTDDSMLRTLEKKVYRDSSYPLFTYRDEQHKMEQEYYDIKYYYLTGAEVRVEIYEDIKTGKVSKEYVPFANHVFVIIDGKEEKYSIGKVTRIL
jgi:hypothetical protein